MNVDVIVIGGGAAGLFCAGVAAQRGLKVALIDHAETLGEKIRISGGGRCNFTNINTTPANFISQNPHFCRSALARYTPADFIALVKKHHIAFHEKTLGQLFCDDRSQQIIDLLVDEAKLGGVKFINPATVQSVEKSDVFRVSTNAGIFNAPNVVIATGGLSIPATGATGFGYEIAKQFGVPLTPLRAGLVPLALDAPDMQKYGELSGVSVDAITSTDGTNSTFGASFRENVLVTHRGLSGPAILQISNYWTAGDAVVIDLLPEMDGEEFLAQARTSKKTFTNLLAQHLPERLAQAWAAAHAPATPVAQWSKSDAQRVANELKAWSLKPSGTLGYKKAEVTLGGVDTRALSSKSMMATAVPGLHFIGEVVDVTGWLGGYNFQWAWASGYACSQELRAAA